MRISPLTPLDILIGFDCGDVDLNEFLLNEAMAYQEKAIANTYLVRENDILIGYFSLLNDKISSTETSKSAWRKIKNRFSHSKHRGNYPAIKIGRLAVDKRYASKGYGSIIMDTIKELTSKRANFSAFRFLTVDAYVAAISFYTKNGFVELEKDIVDAPTRVMYFDMATISATIP